MNLDPGGGSKGGSNPGRYSRSKPFASSWCARPSPSSAASIILVSNAGRQQSSESILDISTEDFDWTMKTNIYAPFWIIKAAVPHLKPGSCIIATTSEQAYDPSPDLYDYAQTKAATMNFVKSLAKQLAQKGIRVNGVAPGPVWTPLQVSGGAQPEKQRNSADKLPLAAPACRGTGRHLCVARRRQASFATGQIYGSSGGAGQPWADQFRRRQIRIFKSRPTEKLCLWEWVRNSRLSAGTGECIDWPRPRR